MEKREIVESVLRMKENASAEGVGELTVRRIATWDMPIVEFAYQNINNNQTIAFLFPNICENEYTWIQEVLNVLSSFDSCIVCISAPKLQDAHYLCDLIIERDLDSLKIAVLSYDSSGQIIVLKSYSQTSKTLKKRSKSEMKSYWCWWRDTSHYEVATLLELSESYDFEKGDIYTQKVYPEFFEMMINKQTKQWDGSPRNKKYSSASYKAEKQNYKIPMCQLGLWDAETGHNTLKGKILLEVSRNHGSDSKRFLNYLSKIILLDGKHLELIKDLDEFQKSYPELIPEFSADFFIMFDDYMVKRNSMGTRKPSAIKTGAKKSYVRDEPKLWNKLGIIIPSGKSRYYWPFKGLKFDWNRINEILLSTENEESIDE